MSSRNAIESGDLVRIGQRFESVFLSVVMPTHNRCDVLARVLRSLEQQIAATDMSVEVVVCDDASSDGTREVLSKAWRFPLRWMMLEKNSGPAVARNRALQLARGEVILFLGDDIEPAHGMLQFHLDWHRQHPEEAAALLGHTTWPAAMNITPFMRFLEHGGNAFFFDYGKLAHGHPLPGTKFYTCHVSLKRSLCLLAGGFDESFPFASHEDLELGLRLEQSGMQLWYDARANAYHWHHLTLEGTVRRVYKMGFSSVLFWRRVAKKRGGWKRPVQIGAANVMGSTIMRRAILRLGRKKPCLPLQWWLLLHLTYWAGVHDGRLGKLDDAFSTTTNDPAPCP